MRLSSDISAVVTGGASGLGRATVEKLRAEGVKGVDKVDESESGKCGGGVDPDGNKRELWEPPAGQ